MAKVKHRSPSNPYLSLDDAVSVLREVYQHERRHLVPVDDIAKHGGYSNLKSSSAQRMVSTLLQYGLMEEVGRGEDRKMRISERGLDIVLNGPDDVKAKVALQEAAKSPEVNQRVFAEYPSELPSDGTLRSFLIRTLNFNDEMAAPFIKRFRDTVAFAKLYDDDKIEDENTNQIEPDDEAASISHWNPFDARKKASSEINAPQTVQMKELPITLPSLAIAVVRLPEKMSELDFTTFVATIQAWKNALVEKPEAGKKQEIVVIDKT